MTDDKSKTIKWRLHNGLDNHLTCANTTENKDKEEYAHVYHFLDEASNKFYTLWIKRENKKPEKKRGKNVKKD